MSGEGLGSGGGRVGLFPYLIVCLALVGALDQVLARGAGGGDAALIEEIEACRENMLTLAEAEETHYADHGSCTEMIGNLCDYFEPAWRLCCPEDGCGPYRLIVWPLPGRQHCMVRCPGAFQSVHGSIVDGIPSW
ncbi:hypothetical protein JW921_00025 [Candidatus Fermentibacterales bacterium]|nr:hypothetical protein [Candidatus Fermentibacterales bacterium]